MRSNAAPDRKRDEENAIAATLAVLIAVGLFGFPQLLIGVLLGGALGGIAPPRIDDPARRREVRGLAPWSIATGLTMGAVLFALRAPLGLDVEGRRFDRAWKSDGIDASALIRYPWGAPPECGDRAGRCRPLPALENAAMRGPEGIASALVFVGLIVCLAAITRWRVERGAHAKRYLDRSIQIGTTGGRRGHPLGLALDELQQGVLVGGSPGAGKTTLLAALAARLPEAVGCAFVDLKGDRSLPGKLGVSPERVFGLGERRAASWNPLDAGNPASWRDILLAAEEWTEPHYRRAAARFVGAVLAALAQVRPAVTLDEVVRLLEQPKRAVGLVREVDGRVQDVLASAISAIESEASLRSGVLGLGNRIALLCDSPASGGRFGAAGGIDLRRVLRGERVLFSLPAAEFSDEAPAIAACAIQSLGAAGQRAAVGDESLRAALVVDEAPRLGGQQLREAVAIGRGAGIGTVVAVQDFADLDYGADGTREAVETGANTWIVMRQVASAEAIANALGSRKVHKETVQRDAKRLFFTDTDMRSVREVDEYVVSPNVIRGLERREAIVWRRLRGRVDRIRVEPTKAAMVH